jgi:hypothetical protein
MWFWIREVLGWALVATSLAIINIGINFAKNTEEPKIFEASVVCFAGLGVLKAGTLLIRISTAARLCRMEAESE